MTARELARSECANHEPDGTCLGVDIRADGTQAMMKQAGERCLVLRGERCPYFEEAVLPLAGMVRDTKRQAAIIQAENDYEEKRRNEHNRPGEDDMERGIGFGPTRREAESTRQPASETRLACRSLGARSARLFGRRPARMGTEAA